MNIVVLEGSPNQNGSSNFLAERFADGARESGHTVRIIDAAHAQIAPCTGCVSCVGQKKENWLHVRYSIIKLYLGYNSHPTSLLCPSLAVYQRYTSNKFFH